MDTLAKVLERFNRKERNHLVRAALGDGLRLPELSDRFRAEVAGALPLRNPIATNAWWATDYHLEWLAGALAIYTEGGVNDALKRPRDNSHHLIKGNQEDIDLIIANGLDLILIEAKGVGNWDKLQLESKVERVDLLFKYYFSAPKVVEATEAVRFHLLLTSPKRPPKEFRTLKRVWALTNSEIPWIELDFPRNALKVSRCNDKGKPDAQAGYWRVMREQAKSGLEKIQLEDTRSRDAG